MRKLLDPDNAELAEVLEKLLLEDIDVTVREVARRHSCLKNASAFTRNDARKALIERAQLQQRETREPRAVEAPRRASVAEKLSNRTLEVEQLELQVKHLVAAHAGLIRSVQLAGGMGALERFWKEYKAVGDAMTSLDALPGTAKVVHLVGRG